MSEITVHKNSPSDPAPSAEPTYNFWNTILGQRSRALIQKQFYKPQKAPLNDKTPSNAQMYEAL